LEVGINRWINNMFISTWFDHRPLQLEMCEEY